MASATQSSSSEGIKQYFVAAVATLATVGAVYQYAAIRYGATGLSTLNKSLATSTLFLLGLVLLLGPLCRMFARFDRWLKFRKELGVLTFYTGAAHVYLSMFVLARRGPWGLYLSSPWSAYPGLIAFIIMFLLLFISLRAVETALGTKLWWKLQYLGARAAFFLIAFHMTVLKYSGWGSWFATRGAEIQVGVPSLPPLAILAAEFSVFVFLVRLSELFGQSLAQRMIQASFLAMLGFTAWLFF